MGESSGIDLSGDIAEVLKVDGPGQVIVLSYVDGEGQPHSTVRSSVHVLDGASLGMWVRNGYIGAFTPGAEVGQSQWTPAAEPGPSGLLAAIGHNPKVSVLYRDPGAMVTYMLEGRARVARDDAEREAVYAGITDGEKRHNATSGERTGTAVVIEVDSLVGGALGAEGVIASHVEMRR